jgi:hypothetical protein
VSAIGSAAAPFTAGASLALVPAGAGLTAMGSASDPTTVKQPTPLQSVSDQDPMAKAKMIADAQSSLPNINAPTDQLNETNNWLEQAKQEALARRNIGRTASV